MKKNKQIGKNVKQLSLEEIERLELLKKVHEKKGRQLTFSDETGSLKEVDELRQLIGKQFEDPEEKYNIYYVGIRKLLMDYLPKGKAYEEMRQIIYDEKNIFLNLGKRKSDHKGIRKSDGRMTFQPVMNEILDIVIKWIGESQNPFDIYREFYMLNEKHGYPHEEYDDTTKAVANAMLKLAERE
ncbi:MAG TPA: hypothetical protein H9853_06030 [Candidatus Sphingobacterium stercoripullorum]|uniref:Uncharacterized protein n=1 Tax=Candidatus Sphingobacterium stercoripullorum TaxID=2838759 RepID=A0A9D2AZ56_9SPHI|nr:hypothetical protein [Candidatus Sphingobacterium stercoripullorum]